MAGTAAYLWPATGAIAPTALQTKDRVVALVTSDGFIGDAVITHNMGLTADDLAAGRPHVNLERNLAASRAAQWIVSAKAANTVTLTQLAAGGAVANIQASISRPHTIGR